MESNGQTIHMYDVEDNTFVNSTEMVQYAIDNEMPLVAYCGDEWLPASTEFLTGVKCQLCVDIHHLPKDVRKLMVKTNSRI